MGYRHEFDGPIGWFTRRDKRAVFYKIELVGEAITPEGQMLVVKLQHNTELANPDNDVAVLVGQAMLRRKLSGIPDPCSPELWMWNDKFWLKAKATDGTVYYHDKCYLFYSIEINEVDKLMQTLDAGFNK